MKEALLRDRNELAVGSPHTLLSLGYPSRSKSRTMKHLWAVVFTKYSKQEGLLHIEQALEDILRNYYTSYTTLPFGSNFPK